MENKYLKISHDVKSIDVMKPKQVLEKESEIKQTCLVVLVLK